MLEVSLLLHRYKAVNELRDPNEAGIDPTRQFCDKSITCKLVKLPSWEGREPVTPTLGRFIPVTSLPVQVTPDQRVHTEADGVPALHEPQVLG